MSVPLTLGNGKFTLHSLHACLHLTGNLANGGNHLDIIVHAKLTVPFEVKSSE
ncbi:hypothetical protein [Terracidiphilus sp.]|uniref:hypothetical protein n=1 Tax=Terracidiphilus sp. TaxID=1964191 RepID=UPI003C1F9C96